MLDTHAQHSTQTHPQHADEAVRARGEQHDALGAAQRVELHELWLAHLYF